MLIVIAWAVQAVVLCPPEEIGDCRVPSNPLDDVFESGVLALARLHQHYVFEDADPRAALFPALLRVFEEGRVLACVLRHLNCEDPPVAALERQCIRVQTSYAAAAALARGVRTPGFEATELGAFQTDFCGRVLAAPQSVSALLDEAVAIVGDARLGERMRPGPAQVPEMLYPEDLSFGRCAFPRRPLFEGDLPEFGVPGRQTPWQDISGLFSRHVPAQALLETIALTEPLSRTLVNFGTFDGACEAGDEYDPVNCILQSPGGAEWRALLIEGDPQQMPKIREFYDSFENVSYHFAFTDKDALAPLLADFYGAAPGDCSATVDVDLLKLDTDHAECAFLEAVLSSSCPAIRPKLIHLEFNPLIPPDYAYMQRYSRKLAVEQNDPFEWMDAEHLSGCSLGAYLQGPVASLYTLLAVEFKNLVLVRKDLAPFFPTAAMSSAETKWLAGWFCQPIARAWRRFEGRGALDFRAFVDPERRGEAGLPYVRTWLDREFAKVTAARPAWAGNTYSLTLLGSDA